MGGESRGVVSGIDVAGGGGRSARGADSGGLRCGAASLDEGTVEGAGAGREGEGVVFARAGVLLRSAGGKSGKGGYLGGDLSARAAERGGDCGMVQGKRDEAVPRGDGK